jgi:hypothetical protein
MEFDLSHIHEDISSAALMVANVKASGIPPPIWAGENANTWVAVFRHMVVIIFLSLLRTFIL